MKVRLDLTVQQSFKNMARALARKRRRSISGLFEDLIEEEMMRVTQKKICQIHIRHASATAIPALSLASLSLASL